MPSGIAGLGASAPASGVPLADRADAPTPFVVLAVISYLPTIPQLSALTLKLSHETVAPGHCRIRHAVSATAAPPGADHSFFSAAGTKAVGADSPSSKPK